MEILKIKDVSVLMKERFLVKNVSFSMQQGQCFGIIGENSSGKTSLIKTISGSLPISDGNIIFMGKEITEEPKVLSEVGLCLDPPVFFKYETVINNFEYLCSLTGKADKEKIEETLKIFHLDGKQKKKVIHLSYYEKKLMALALAFINEPKLLILDEPFKSLPAALALSIRKYIEALKAKGTTLIVTSRNYDNIEDLCDYYIFMEKRTIKHILPRKQCEKYSTAKTYAFIAVKYPNYCGKLIRDQYHLDVKLFGNKVLFEANEDTTADIVGYFSRNKIAVYNAGYLSKKSEKIFANLTPFFKEEN